MGIGAGEPRPGGPVGTNSIESGRIGRQGSSPSSRSRSEMPVWARERGSARNRPRVRDPLAPGASGAMGKKRPGNSWPPTSGIAPPVQWGLLAVRAFWGPQRSVPGRSWSREEKRGVGLRCAVGPGRTERGCGGDFVSPQTAERSPGIRCGARGRCPLRRLRAFGVRRPEPWPADIPRRPECCPGRDNVGRRRRPRAPPPPRRRRRWPGFR